MRVARYANHFSSLLGSPKIPFCRVQFLSSRTSRIETNFLLPFSQLPENPCCYSTVQCCSPLRMPGLETVFLLSFVRPKNHFLESRILVARKRSFFGPLLLRHWCTNPCCSTTAEFVFLVRVARYANHFSVLSSPKNPFCRQCSFYPAERAA